MPYTTCLILLLTRLSRLSLKKMNWKNLILKKFQNLQHDQPNPKLKNPNPNHKGASSAPGMVVQLKTKMTVKTNQPLSKNWRWPSTGTIKISRLTSTCRRTSSLCTCRACLQASELQRRRWVRALLGHRWRSESSKI